MIITFDANIGAGKSTLLNELEKKLDPSRFSVILEPVDSWTKTHEGKKSILELFYEDPSRYSFLFQMYVLQTRFEKWDKMIKENTEDKIILCERNLMTDFHIFAKMQYETHLMSENEFYVYKKWYAFLEQMMKPEFSHIIYLRVLPEVCFERMQNRARKGEDHIKLEYLHQLHDKHESWLGIKNTDYNVHIIDYNDNNLELCVKKVMDKLSTIIS